MREELLKIIERNSRIDLKELAVILASSVTSRSYPPEIRYTEVTSGYL